MNVNRSGVLNASGYAGVLSNGWIVDRREWPKAIPIQKNEMFGVVDPKEVTEQQRNFLLKEGLTFPMDERELAVWDEHHKDYPYQLSSKKIDPQKIMKELEKLKQ